LNTQQSSLNQFKGESQADSLSLELTQPSKTALKRMLISCHGTTPDSSLQTGRPWADDKSPSIGRIAATTSRAKAVQRDGES
jgi:hypothetical protein